MINKIQKRIKERVELGFTPAMIIMNKRDVNELKENVDFLGLNLESETLLGLELIVIPYYLKDEHLVKLGEALVLEKCLIDFLKETFAK